MCALWVGQGVAAGLSTSTDAPLRVQTAGDGLIRHLAGLVSESGAPEQQAMAAKTLASVKGAVLNHPEFAAATAQLGYGREVVHAAEAGWRPQIYGNASAGYRRTDGVRSSHPSVGLGVNQLLYDFGATTAQVDAANAGVSAANAALQAKQATLTMRAITAWHELYRARKQFALQRLNVSSRREIADFVKERAELGGSSMSDVLRARARQTEAEASVALAEARVQSAEAAWLEAFGQPAPAQVEIGISLPSGKYRNRLPELSRRFAVVEEKFAQAARLNADAQATHAAKLPRLSLDVSTAKEISGHAPADQAALLMVKYNFYTGGAETARAAQAQMKAAQAEAEAQNELRQTEKALLQVIAEVESAPLILSARKQAVTVAGDSLEAVREQFAFRRGTLLDLLRTEEDVYYAGRDLIDALVDSALAGHRLRYLASEWN